MVIVTKNCIQNRNKMDTTFICLDVTPKRYKAKGINSPQRVHDLSHTFDCKHCGKKFYESWTLARHTSTIHDKKTMYVCTEGGKCAWGFVSAHKENLAKHKGRCYKVKRQLSLDVHLVLEYVKHACR